MSVHCYIRHGGGYCNREPTYMLKNKGESGSTHFICEEHWNSMNLSDKQVVLRYYKLFKVKL